MTDTEKLLKQMTEELNLTREANERMLEIENKRETRNRNCGWMIVIGAFMLYFMRLVLTS